MTNRVNAKKGVTILYYSMVLLMISELSEILEGFLETEIVDIGIDGTLCAMIATVFVFAAVIVQTIGLFIARKDVIGYDKACKLLIGCNVLVVAFAFLESYLIVAHTVDISELESPVNIVSSVMSLIVDYLVIMTTVELMEQYQCSQIAEDGREAWKKIMQIFIATIVIALIEGIALAITTAMGLHDVSDGISTAGATLEAIVNILDILAYAKFRKFLKKAYPHIS